MEVVVLPNDPTKAEGGIVLGLTMAIHESTYVRVHACKRGMSCHVCPRASAIPTPTDGYRCAWDATHALETKDRGTIT